MRAVFGRRTGGGFEDPFRRWQSAREPAPLPVRKQFRQSWGAARGWSGPFSLAARTRRPFRREHPSVGVFSGDGSEGSCGERRASRGRRFELQQPHHRLAAAWAERGCQRFVGGCGLGLRADVQHPARKEGDPFALGFGGGVAKTPRDGGVLDNRAKRDGRTGGSPGGQGEAAVKAKRSPAGVRRRAEPPNQNP